MTDLLSPSLANFTQSGYLVLSVMTALAVTLMADEPGFTGTLLKALLAGGMVCIVTGLIDIAAASTGMESLLAPFRNAEYAYLTTMRCGARKVVGFTPEASAYGPICVNLPPRWLSADPLCGPSAAHVRDDSCGQSGGNGPALYVLHCLWGLAYWGWFTGGTGSGARILLALGQGGLLGELLVGLGLIIALLFVLIAHADLLNPLLSVIDEQIFNKALSGSFYERSHWNTTAWDALASTWGLGIGFGSTRTSNWFASVSSNTGLIGTAFMGVFLVQIFARRSISRTPLSMELLSALKLSLVPALVMAGVNSPGPDFGLWIGVVFGAI